jgi:hypothetical protein
MKVSRAVKDLFLTDQLGWQEAEEIEAIVSTVSPEWQNTLRFCIVIGRKGENDAFRDLAKRILKNEQTLGGE